MDELSEEDKLTVARARKIQRFLSQPFAVAEVFTGKPGRYVELKASARDSSCSWRGWGARTDAAALQTFAGHDQRVPRCAGRDARRPARGEGRDPLRADRGQGLSNPAPPPLQAAFYMVGDIVEVKSKAEAMAKEVQNK